MTIRQSWIGSLVLMAALCVPAAMLASPVQDRDDQNRNAAANDQHHDNDRDNKDRVYDRKNKDYHNWNSDEERQYSDWQREHRYAENRNYNQLSHKQQDQYWAWRHQHQNGYQSSNRDRDDH